MEGVEPGLLVAGRYTLRRRIEAVRDTERWTAEDATLGRSVVILLVGAEDSRAEGLLDAARRTAALDLGAFLRVLDVGTEDNHAYVVEEDISGSPSMASLIMDAGLPTEEVRRIVGEVSVALDAASRRGLHHLELGPGEVFRTADGEIRVRGLEVAAARSGRTAPTGDDALRADAISVLALTYAGLTGTWPGLASVRGTSGGLPLAPRASAGPSGADVPAPSELVSGVPRDLDTLCRLTLVDDAGPVSPGDFARQIAPWSSRTVMGGAPALPRVGADQTAVLDRMPSAHAVSGEPGAADDLAAEPTPRPEPTIAPEDRAERAATPLPATDGDSAPASEPSAVPDHQRVPVAPQVEVLAAVARTAPRDAPPTPALPSPTPPAPAPPPAAAPITPAAPPAPEAAAPSRAASSTAAPPAALSTSAASSAGSSVSAAASSAAGSAAAAAGAVGTALTGVGGKVADFARKAVDKVSELAPETIPTDSQQLEAPAPLVSNEVLNRRESRIALAIVATFLLAALALGVKGVLSIGQQPYGPPPASAAASPPVSATPTASPSGGLEDFQVIAAADFDPLGGDGENPQLAARVYDGDKASEWQSERYWTAQFGGVKRGVGILVDIGPNKAPKKVEVTLTTPASLEVYVASDRSLDGATKIGSASMAKGTITVTAPKAVKGQYVIVWFTELSKDDTGRNDYRARVGEISVSG